MGALCIKQEERRGRFLSRSRCSTYQYIHIVYLLLVARRFFSILIHSLYLSSAAGRSSNLYFRLSLILIFLRLDQTRSRA